MSPNIVIPNIVTGGYDQFKCIWYLTRAMKAAGWIYKASSDGTGATSNKDTTTTNPLNNPIKDMWGPGSLVGSGTQLGSQTGSLATIASNSSSFFTLSNLTGMTTSSAGHAITLSGGTKPSNNGTFTITKYNSATSVDIWNPNGSGDGVNTYTWSERVSGTSSITWSATTRVREQTINGLSGMTSNSAGRYLNLDGAVNSTNNGCFRILSFISSSSVVIINSGGVSETASGNWTELDATTDIYPGSPAPITMGPYAWIVLQGPSTLKIPINAPSSGKFFRGENIVQSGSGAEGELIGYQYDFISSSGYLVVLPRITGTGVGRLGWHTSSSTITGLASGVTVTTGTSTPIEFIREVVFWRGYDTTNTSSNMNLAGSIYYQCVDAAGEAGYRFSYLATQSGCTGGSTGVAPGGTSSGGNFFPLVGTFVAKGVSQQNNPKYWVASVSATALNVLGKCHIMVANADYTSHTSPDGSFTLACGLPTINPGAYAGFFYQRLDNNEEGDVDPYAWFFPTTTTGYTTDNRTNGGNSAVPLSPHFSFSVTGLWNYVTGKGFRRRGFATDALAGSNNDNYQSLTFGSFGYFSGLMVPSTAYYADAGIEVTNISLLPQRVRHPIYAFSDQAFVAGPGETAAGRMVKGTFRWAFYVPSGGRGGDLLDNKTFILLSSNYGPIAAGPWDGYTTPMQV